MLKLNSFRMNFLRSTRFTRCTSLQSQHFSNIDNLSTNTFTNVWWHSKIVCHLGNVGRLDGIHLPIFAKSLAEFNFDNFDKIPFFFARRDWGAIWQIPKTRKHTFIRKFCHQTSTRFGKNSADCCLKQQVRWRSLQIGQKFHKYRLV